MASKKGAIPTVSQIINDRITEIAGRYWAPFTENHEPFNPKIVAEIYQNELLRTNFSTRRVMLLEFSQYLERFLWPNYDPSVSSLEHVLSIIVIVNEKFRERVPAWDIFKKLPANFPGFFRRVMEAALDSAETSYIERTQVIQFLIRCFNSVEVDLVRNQIQKLVALPIWINLLPGRRDEMFRANPKLKKFWQLIHKHDAKLGENERQEVEQERRFLASLMENFLSIVDSIPETDEPDPTCIRYCESVLQLLIDLEALLPTRRFFNTLLDSCHVVTRCSLSPLAHRPEGRLFQQLLDMLKFYTRFEINDLSGEPLSESDMTLAHYNSITSLQKAAFKNFKDDLKEFYLLNVASVDTNAMLKKYFGRLTKEQLYNIAEMLNLMPPVTGDDSALDKHSKDFLLELLVTRHERRQSQLDYINELPLYPTEKVIWDENLVPNEYFSGESSLALNKLNLQFLTLYDYLLRNFNLFALESTYEIRQDVEDALFRLKPWKHETESSVVFGGWARMALPITTFSIVEVAKPQIGERSPAVVRADVTINLNTRPDIRREWEGLRKHDVCFLVTARPEARVGTRYDVRQPFKDQIQVAYVRGCEIEGMLGPDGRVIDEWSFEPKPTMPGTTRTFRVWLDCSQYRLDMERNIRGEEDVYETFNVFIRRKPKENNFKAVLETIRQLMNTKFVVPDWLHDILLGYGDPGAAHYTKMPNAVETLDFNDTFLDIVHLKQSFPDYEVVSEVDDWRLVPPFRVTFSDSKSKKRKGRAEEDSSGDGADKKEIIVETVVVPSAGPYPYLVPKQNSIRFTPVQVEAIRAGMQPGLTMVVGPPGTGKTDVAVQIISNIYHNWPEQRTLIITHSNQALNQLFEKIMQLDIDERHLLRLGHGEESLETEKDFSRYGRVNYILSKRLELLSEVERLQLSLGVPGDVAYTCETAADFFLYQVHARWEAYLAKIRKRPDQEPVALEDVGRHFPFTLFFANAPQPLFRGLSYEEDYEIAQSCWRHISRIFQQLDEFRAFELLRTGRDRAEYLLVKEAKIIAMTCTHAALRRRDLVQMGFRYDNVLMEEAAQILEIETFIPLLLQEPQDGRNRLKRWIMIGDHHQLPPVIKNMAFQKYCNMEQSLFARLVALGVPTVDLDMQGRARPSLASLYNWRYKRMGNLKHVERTPEYQLANAGFVFDYQLIDVGDYNGVGESAPSPYFYQNLAEAEYAVALFMYMRILGYPAEKISILTTYNGQKHLLRDVIEQRCANNPLFGRPHKVTTVDKYQGQQNDYIILSLVRTSTVGHLRDVRRLVVALSRARLGMYVLARVSLFRNCFELTPAFNLLCERPQKLILLPYETWPTERKVADLGPQEDHVQIEDMSHMAQFVFEFYRANAEALKQAWREAQGITDRGDADLNTQPYNEGKVETNHSVDIEKAQKEEGGKVEKDIEFEMLDEQAASSSAPAS